MFRYTHRYPGGRVRTTTRTLLICMALLTVTVAGVADAFDDEPFAAHEIMAGYLFNFPNFVTWETDPPQPTAAAITFCSSTSNLVVDALQPLLDGELIDGKPLRYRTVSSLAAAGGCQVLFIEGGSDPLATDNLGALPDQPILTVSNQAGFARRGGMIELARKENRIHPIINVDAARGAGIQINSRLLRLATIVRTGAQ